MYAMSDEMENGFRFPMDFHVLRPQGASHWGLTSGKVHMYCRWGSWLPHATPHTHTAKLNKPVCQLSPVVTTVMFACSQRPKAVTLHKQDCCAKTCRRPKQSWDWKSITIKNGDATCVWSYQLTCDKSTSNQFHFWRLGEQLLGTASL